MTSLPRALCQPAAVIQSLLIALLIMPACAIRADERRVLEEIVVAASRLGDSGANRSALVLDAEQLVIEAPASIADALQRLPGVYLSQPGGRGGVGTLSVRGGEGNFTTVLIDGVQVNDPTNTRGGSFDFNSIDMADVERVELLRGAAAAIHGSDALAGVINIVTRRPGSGGRAALTIGEDALQQASFGVGFGSEEAAAVGITVANTRDDNRTAVSDFDATSVRVVAVQRGEAQRVSAQLGFSSVEQRSFPEDSGGAEFAVLRERDQRDADELIAAVTFARAFDSGSIVRAIAAYHRHDELADSPGIAPGARNPFGVPANRFDSRFERTEVTLSGERSWGVTQLVGGFQLQREDGESKGEVDFLGSASFELERDTVSAFVEFMTSPTNRLDVGGGMRFDKAGGNPSQVSYSLTADVDLWRGVSAFGRMAAGFKLPSFFALASPLVGNPNLEPEEVKDIEYGLRADLKPDLALEVLGYRSRYRGLIDFDAATFTNVNLNRATMTGVELSLSGSLLSQRLRYRAFASNTDIDLRPEGRLRQRPDWRYGGVITVDPAGDAVSVNLSWQYNDTRFDSSVPSPSIELDSYQRVDLAVHWKFAGSFRLTAAVDNIANERYFDAYGFPSLGRRARLSAEIVW